MKLQSTLLSRSVIAFCTSLATLLWTLSCPAVAGAAAGREAGGFLSEDQARLRSRQISGLKYDLSLELTEDKPSFSGTVRIEFTLSPVGRPLTLDFTNGVIRQVRLNGNPIEADYNGWFLSLPERILQAGRNTLAIDFEHAYSNNGAGLHRTRDPEDGAVYLYTQFEPYDANQMFPCFDQPDLKAVYRLRVSAPAEWTVISSVRETAINKKGTAKEWVFPESARFSTYTFAVHAGPYRVWESMAGNIPLRLFARRSIARHVTVDEWFELTRQGFDYFQTYFGIEHPYAKYDQLIVPEFNMGAMENVGAVTFSEFFVKRGKPTAEDQEQLAYVIMHEMAHMWFGNMVTMRWWDDLWLNESFATLMGYAATAEATRYRNAWHNFHVRSTLPAYHADQLVTTHPVATPVRDTLSGFANFDAITYGKGAAVLKQLMYYVGPENFRKGVSDYLRGHAGGNTQLEDFIAALERASGRNLDGWVDLWLRKAGLNSIRPEYACKDGVLKKLKLRQTAPKGQPWLRAHTLQLGLFREADGRMLLLRRLPAEVKGRTSAIKDLDKDACPDLVFPNYGDQGYIKIEYAQADLLKLPARITLFDEPLLRSMLWSQVWEGVRDARLPLTVYADAALESLPGETDIKVTRQLLQNAERAFDYFNLFGEPGRPLLAHYGPKYEALAWQKARSGDQDLQKLWFDHYTTIAHTDAALKNLETLLRGKLEIPGLVIDQDRRWRIIRKLSARGHTGADELLEREARQDLSDAGRKAAIAARAAAPSLANKQYWLSQIQARERTLALADLRAAMSDLFADGQYAFLQSLQPAILAALPGLQRQESAQYLGFYARYLVQGYCRAESVAQLSRALDANPGATPTVLKQLQIARQEDRRCLAMLDLIED